MKKKLRITLLILSCAFCAMFMFSGCKNQITPNSPVNPNMPNIPTYTITWKNHDGTVLEIDYNVSEGSTPTYDGKTPIRQATDNNTYEFSGWSPDLSCVYENQTYTAQFTEKSSVIPELPEEISPILEKPDYTFDGNGTEQSPYLIKTSAQLLGIAKFADKHFILANDIALPLYSENRPNFQPLFSDEKPFTGTFDGNSYKIKNLYLYNTETYYTGLFACIGKAGTVKNLTLENVNIYGTNYIGAISGLSFGTISNCSVSGKITYVPANDFAINIGGIVGRCLEDIVQCSSDTIIKAHGALANCLIGGIVGYNDSDCFITKSYNTGDITVKSNGATVGGIVGSGGFVNNSYNNGAITINTKYDVSVGGITGAQTSRNAQRTSNIKNTGIITVNSGNGAQVGGLIGSNLYSGHIIESYNIGNIAVNSGNLAQVGGLLGFGYMSIKDSYNIGNITVDSERNGVYVGGLAGYLNNFITTSYSACKINATVDSVYNTGGENVGGLVGRGANYTSITNGYWLQIENNVPKNAIGYNENFGVPTDFGATKHTAITDFYALASKLNGERTEPVWENKADASLPTLIIK